MLLARSDGPDANSRVLLRLKSSSIHICFELGVARSRGASHFLLGGVGWLLVDC